MPFEHTPNSETVLSERNIEGVRHLCIVFPLVFRYNMRLQHNETGVKQYIFKKYKDQVGAAETEQHFKF